MLSTKPHAAGGGPRVTEAEEATCGPSWAAPPAFLRVVLGGAEAVQIADRLSWPPRQTCTMAGLPPERCFLVPLQEPPARCECPQPREGQTIYGVSISDARHFTSPKLQNNPGKHLRPVSPF